MSSWLFMKSGGCDDQLDWFNKARLLRTKQARLETIWPFQRCFLIFDAARC